jgi:GntR family transcriptional regulator
VDEIKVEQGSSVPIYLQIVDRIKHLVAVGRLKPGEQLPTIRQLAAELRINYNTVARAYLLLDKEGVISTQQGRGTYIAEHPDEEKLALMRRGRLWAMLGGVVLEAKSLGYTDEEIRAAFEGCLAAFEQSTDRESRTREPQEVYHDS